ncbi:MAG: hypothetical protein Q4F29_09410 [Lachnospiraceae bacterium]|nr:hypothetical protein [Lachnospiraceae bacterium]
MNKPMKRIVWGIVLATFSINLFGIPIFPKIVGYGLWLWGICGLIPEPEQTEEKWTKGAGILMTAACGIGMAVGWTPLGDGLWVRQIGAILMVSETVCGFGLMNMQEDRGWMPEWYLSCSLAALFCYEYVITIGGGMAGFWGGAAGIAARILLIVKLQPNQKREGEPE